MISTANPTFKTYTDLQKFYSHTLRCPCSTMAIPYHKFMSLSPILHQICSSELIEDKWLTILHESAIVGSLLDWRSNAYQQFKLLSQLCKLANETVTNTTKEFLSQSFFISNILTEIDFNIQIEDILAQFYQSIIVYFYHLISIVNLYIQVDQPYMMVHVEADIQMTPVSLSEIMFTSNNESYVEVCIYLLTCVCRSLSSLIIMIFYILYQSRASTQVQVQSICTCTCFPRKKTN